jgi:hypothetical protein
VVREIDMTTVEQVGHDMSQDRLPKFCSIYSTTLDTINLPFFDLRAYQASLVQSEHDCGR